MMGYKCFCGLRAMLLTQHQAFQRMEMKTQPTPELTPTERLLGRACVESSFHAVVSSTDQVAPPSQ